MKPNKDTDWGLGMVMVYILAIVVLVLDVLVWRP